MGDLSRTVSESLGDILRKWGIPAIPRPRINAVYIYNIQNNSCSIVLEIYSIQIKCDINIFVNMTSVMAAEIVIAKYMVGKARLCSVSGRAPYRYLTYIENLFYV